MRLMIHKNLSSSLSGPGVFSGRLAKCLSEEFGVQIVRKKPDIVLCGISMKRVNIEAPKVFRVDGCYCDVSVRNYRTRNNHLRRAIQRADGIVFQSKFSKDLILSILHPRKIYRKKSAIIYNGFDQSIVPDVQPIDKDCDWLFVANAKWRPDKRPESILRGFLEADVPNSKLVMIGMEPPRLPMFNTEKIQFIPFVPPEQLYPYYKAADALIHLRYLEPCSNSVIEALSFGLPVICNNTGGTPEIVGNDGYAIPCDEYNFTYHRGVVEVPPKQTAQAIWDCVNDGHRKVSRPDLDMRTVAKGYLNFFAEILDAS